MDVTIPSFDLDYVSWENAPSIDNTTSRWAIGSMKSNSIMKLIVTDIGNYYALKKVAILKEFKRTKVNSQSILDFYLGKESNVVIHNIVETQFSIKEVQPKDFKQKLCKP